MPVRFYFPTSDVSAPAAPVSIDPSGRWDNGVTAYLGRKLIASADTASAGLSNTTDYGGAVSANGSWILTQAVSDPLDAQTIDGTLSFAQRGRKWADGGTAIMRVVITAWSGDGTTLRGILLDSDLGAEVPFDYAPGSFRGLTNASLTPITLQAGDRVVVETGYRITNYSSSFSAYLWNGKSSTDLVNGSEASGASPWVEFSVDILNPVVAPDPTPDPTPPDAEFSDYISWDQAGNRDYETGVDRGVLYVENEPGVPWNGLTSVDEILSGVESEPLHYDGVKYFDTRTPGDFVASLKAFTYPDKFSEFDGSYEVAAGLFFTHQPVRRTFGLSYRTLIGNDLDPDLGYKIHLAYNLTATPDDRTYSTITNVGVLTELGWTITGVPEAFPGVRPTAHVVLDSRKTDPELLKGIEDILYGSASGIWIGQIDGGTAASTGSDILDGGSPYITGSNGIDGGTPLSSDGQLGAPGPRLPSLSELVSIFENWETTAA